MLSNELSLHIPWQKHRHASQEQLEQLFALTALVRYKYPFVNAILHVENEPRKDRDLVGVGPGSYAVGLADKKAEPRYR